MRTIGVERERFIADPKTGKILPAINILLPEIHAIAGDKCILLERFSYELFAGQVEDKTPSCSFLAALAEAMEINEEVMAAAANMKGLVFDFSEIIEESQMQSLQVNPFSQRHQELWQTLPHERKVAASGVAAVHVHVGTTLREAVQVLNFCRRDVIETLVSLGDHSSGKRISAYRKMAQTDGVPPVLSLTDIMEYIQSCGGEKNVWDLVRYKPSTGTVEFRMFGTTPHQSEIIGYVEACLGVVESSLS